MEAFLEFERKTDPISSEDISADALPATCSRAATTAITRISITTATDAES